MLIIRGVNVYPTQIEEMLAQVAGLSPHYRLVVTREGTLDELEVQCETDAQGELEGRRVDPPHVVRLIRETVGVTTKVTLHDAGSLPRSEGGKLSRVLDQRDLG
jgi:phenylacetate-CoA ligase